MPSDSKKKREQKKKEALKKRDVKKPAGASKEDGEEVANGNGEIVNGNREIATTNGVTAGIVFVCVETDIYFHLQSMQTSRWVH